MLPIKNRLKKKKDFEKVLKEGKSVKWDGLALKYCSNSFKESRFGIIVSKKVSKKAVVRNKIKRRIREILRRELEKIKKSQDIVFFVFPEFKNKEFPEVQKIVIKLLKKGKLLKND